MMGSVDGSRGRRCLQTRARIVVRHNPTPDRMVAMKKLKLEIEELAVESFATAEGTAEPGTVRAYATEMGRTCGFDNTCGPETCGDMHCILDSQNMNLCGTGGCPGPTNTCPPPSGQMSCVGCTTYDYTQLGGDSCDYCLSFYTDSPQHCPCI
jgi:hypothetical protein